MHSNPNRCRRYLAAVPGKSDASPSTPRDGKNKKQCRDAVGATSPPSLGGHKIGEDDPLWRKIPPQEPWTYARNPAVSKMKCDSLRDAHNEESTDCLKAKSHQTRIIAWRIAMHFNANLFGQFGLNSNSGLVRMPFWDANFSSDGIGPVCFFRVAPLVQKKYLLFRTHT